MKYIIQSIAILLLLTFCTSCSFLECKKPEPEIKTIITIKNHYIKVPESFLDLKEIPEVPEDVSKQSAVANYIIDLYSNDKLCHDNIQLIKDFNTKNTKNTKSTKSTKKGK